MSESEYMRQKHANARARFTGDKKQCTSCDRWLTLDNFHAYKGGLGGVKARCKPCCNAPKRTGDAAREARRRAYTESHKQCAICKQWKTHDKFHKNRKGLGGITASCRECVSQRNKRYRAAMTEDQWQETLKSSRERRREASAAERAKIMSDTRQIITELDRLGLSRRQVFRMSGVTELAMRRIMSKSRSYTWPATRDKLRQTLDVVMGMD